MASTENVTTRVARTPVVADATLGAFMQDLASANDRERVGVEAEQRRLAKKYGATSPQAVAMAMRLDALGRDRVAIDAAVVRAKIVVPKLDAESFVIVGRIVDAGGAGVAGVAVAAVDAKGAVRARGKTGGEGVFEMRVTAGSRGSQGRLTEVEATAPAAPGLRIQVADRSKRTFTSDDVLPAAAGRLAYREIALPAEWNVSRPSQARTRSKRAR